MKISLIFVLVYNFLTCYGQTNCWSPKPNLQMFGGTQISAQSTEECQNLCLSTPGCKAIEYTGNCYTFNIDAVPTASNPAIIHYILTCSCSWKPYVESQSYGGIFQNDVTSLDQCKTKCIKQGFSNCLAVEWETSKNQCFFFKTKNSPTYSNVKNIDHYIWDCQSQGVSVTPTIAATIPQPSAAPTCTWQISYNSNTPGGSLQSTALNIDLCKQACIGNFNCMYGFDWNSNEQPGRQCWLSITENIVNNNLISHYKYNCTASNTPYWNVTYGYNSPGGVLMPSVYSIDDCKVKCTRESSCYYGFDWDNRAAIGAQCWISVSNKLTSYSQVDHYGLTQGLPTQSPVDQSPCTWNSFANSNSPGGVAKPLYTTIPDCQKYCRTSGKAVCTGIDWDPNNFFKCWFSTSNYTNINGFKGVTHYNYSCPGDPEVGPSTQSASTQHPKKFNNSKIKINFHIAVGWGCNNYRVYYNSAGKFGDGILKPYTDQTICRNQCTVQPSCKAYEWRDDSADKCWFYSSEAAPPYVGTVSFRTYYLFVPC
ncbi:hypothetical protein HELRODRAFT_194006 [Helobdella robusta]|uniref:Apple domain-containing protein n=1 Tax=Helobdella robusta TaxID=6412 RepID=T1FVK2_HELRO|nr:hypothetical protein HELRODRAFT_194006 [Helobdella robusta]ESN93647.1 hypothetical protein HELRODRAFT_194006 [Helobdella robusta]